MKKEGTHKNSYWLNLVVGLLLVFMLSGLTVNAAEEGKLTIQRFQVEQYQNLKQSTGQSDDIKDIPVDAQIIEDVEYKLEKLLVANTDTQVTPSAPLDMNFTAKIQRTDAKGETIFTNLPKGYYLVTEGTLSGHNAHTKRFVVQIPNTIVDANGNETTNYDVVVYPKGQRIQVEKSVSSEKQVVGIGDIVTWDVWYPMGPDLKREETIDGVVVTSYGKNFYLTDEMDSRLDYVKGSVLFRYYDIYENEITDLVLEEGIDYYLPYDASARVLTIAFTDNVGTNKVADANVAYIRMALDTRVTASALDTTEALWNNARIAFENTAGDPYEHEVFPRRTNIHDSRVPKVYLGQIIVTKVDAQDPNIYLEGATFYLADSKENAKAGNFLKRVVTESETLEEGSAIAYFAVNTEGENRSERVTDEVETLEEISITTDANGQATIYTLSTGTYYLVETKAPDGYKNLTEPIEVYVANDGERHITEVEIRGTKEGAVQSPSTDTGGKATANGNGSGVKTGDMARVLGLFLLITASIGIIVLYIRRKKEKEVQE